MKKYAFWLLASVIGWQLTLISLTLTACLRTANIKCTDGKMAEMILSLTAQSFALYAAEK
jgi:hypothetical protein